MRNQKPVTSNQKPVVREQALVSVLWYLVSIIRYRFFLLAGFFPYLLGQALVYNFKGSLDWANFFLGLAGLFFVLIGIETFNEYFDVSLGTELVFSPNKIKTSPWVFRLGIISFGVAFIFALLLTLKVGPAILVFAFLGFLACFFYLGPPLRLAYRGLGEIVIGLSYGPLLTLGSFWLQAARLDLRVLLVSSIAGLLMFTLALINEVPDYHQDRLVGKRNIVVRIGKKRAVLLYSIVLFTSFALLGQGIFLKIFSPKVGLVFLTFPVVLRSISIAQKYYDEPLQFISTIRNTVFLYVIILSALILTYIQR